MRLPLLQLGDSALPIGGFSHSWGLEAALERGLVASPAALEEWTRRWLTHSVAPTEGVVLVAAFRALRSGDTANIVRANRYLDVGLLPVDAPASEPRHGGPATPSRGSLALGGAGGPRI